MFLFLSIAVIGAIITFILNVWLGTPHFGYSWWLLALMIIASIIAVVLIDAVFAWLPTALPEKCYKSDKGLYGSSKRRMRFYEKLGIKKWKDRIWELGSLNGFSKAAVTEPDNPAYFDRFILESKIGILCHFLGGVFGFCVIFILPIEYALVIGVPVGFVNLVINMMSFMVLKYNLPKLRVAKMRAERIASRNQTKGESNE